MVSKVFEKLLNNKIIDHLEKCGLLSDFQYCFKYSPSTVDLLTVVFDRTARVLTGLDLLQLYTGLGQEVA